MSRKIVMVVSNNFEGLDLAAQGLEYSRKICAVSSDGSHDFDEPTKNPINIDLDLGAKECSYAASASLKRRHSFPQIPPKRQPLQACCDETTETPHTGGSKSDSRGPSCQYLSPTSRKKKALPRKRNLLRPVAENLSSKLRRSTKRVNDKSRELTFGPEIHTGRWGRRSFNRQNSDIAGPTGSQVRPTDSPKFRLSRSRTSPIPIQKNAGLDSQKLRRESSTCQSPRKGESVKKNRSKEGTLKFSVCRVIKVRRVTPEIVKPDKIYGLSLSENRPKSRKAKRNEGFAKAQSPTDSLMTSNSSIELGAITANKPSNLGRTQRTPTRTSPKFKSKSKPSLVQRARRNAYTKSPIPKIPKPSLSKRFKRQRRPQRTTCSKAANSEMNSKPRTYQSSTWFNSDLTQAGRGRSSADPAYYSFVKGESRKDVCHNNCGLQKDLLQDASEDDSYGSEDSADTFDLCSTSDEFDTSNKDEASDYTGQDSFNRDTETMNEENEKEIYIGIVDSESFADLTCSTDLGKDGNEDKQSDTVETDDDGCDGREDDFYDTGEFRGLPGEIQESGSETEPSASESSVENSTATDEGENEEKAGELVGKTSRECSNDQTTLVVEHQHSGREEDPHQTKVKDSEKVDNHALPQTNEAFYNAKEEFLYQTNQEEDGDLIKSTNKETRQSQHKDPNQASSEDPYRTPAKGEHSKMTLPRCCCQDGREPRLTVQEMVKCLQVRAASLTPGCANCCEDGTSKPTAPCQGPPPRRRLKTWVPVESAGNTDNAGFYNGAALEDCADLSGRPKPRPRMLVSKGGVGPPETNANRSDGLGDNRPPTPKSDCQSQSLGIHSESVSTDVEFDNVSKSSSFQEKLTPHTLKEQARDPKAFGPTARINNGTEKKLLGQRSGQNNMIKVCDSLEASDINITHSIGENVAPFEVILPHCHQSSGAEDITGEDEEKANFVTVSISDQSSSSIEASTPVFGGTPGNAQVPSSKNSPWAEAFEKAKLTLRRMRSRSLSPAQVGAKINWLVENGASSITNAIKSWSNIDASGTRRGSATARTGNSEEPTNRSPDISEPLAGPSVPISSSHATSISALQGDANEPIYCLSIRDLNVSVGRRCGSGMNSHRVSVTSTSARSTNSREEHNIRTLTVNGCDSLKKQDWNSTRQAGASHTLYDETKRVKESHNNSYKTKTVHKESRKYNEEHESKRAGCSAPNSTLPRCETKVPSVAVMFPSPLCSIRARSPPLESILETDSVSEGGGCNLWCEAYDDGEEPSESACVEELPCELMIEPANNDIQFEKSVTPKEMTVQHLQKKEVKRCDSAEKDQQETNLGTTTGAQTSTDAHDSPSAHAEIPTRQSLSDCSRDTAVRHGDFDDAPGFQDDHNAAPLLSSSAAPPVRSQSLVTTSEAGLSESGITDMMALISQEASIRRCPSFPDLTDLDDDGGVAGEPHGGGGGADLDALGSRESLTAIQALADLDRDDDDDSGVPNNNIEAIHCCNQETRFSPDRDSDTSSSQKACFEKSDISDRVLQTNNENTLDLDQHIDADIISETSPDTAVQNEDSISRRAEVEIPELSDKRHTSASQNFERSHSEATHGLLCTSRQATPCTSPPPSIPKSSNMSAPVGHHNSPHTGVQEPVVKVGTIVSLLESCKVLSETDIVPVQLHGSSADVAMVRGLEQQHHCATHYHTTASEFPEAEEPRVGNIRDQSSFPAANSEDKSEQVDSPNFNLPSPPISSPCDLSQSTHSDPSSKNVQTVTSADDQTDLGDRTNESVVRKKNQEDEVIEIIDFKDRGECDQEKRLHKSTISEENMFQMINEASAGHEQNKESLQVNVLDADKQLYTAGKLGTANELCKGVKTKEIIEPARMRDEENREDEHTANKQEHEESFNFEENNDISELNSLSKEQDCERKRNETDAKVSETTAVAGGCANIHDNTLLLADDGISLSAIAAINATSSGMQLEGRGMDADSAGLRSSPDTSALHSSVEKESYCRHHATSVVYPSVKPVAEQDVAGSSVNDIVEFKDAASEDRNVPLSIIDSDDSNSPKAIQGRKNSIGTETDTDISETTKSKPPLDNGKDQSRSDTHDIEDKTTAISPENEEPDDAMLSLYVNEDSACDLSLTSQSRSYRSLSTDEDKSSGAGEVLPLVGEAEIRKRRKKKHLKHMQFGEGTGPQPDKIIKVGPAGGRRSPNSRALSNQGSPDLNAAGASHTYTTTSTPAKVGTSQKARLPPRAAIAQRSSGAISGHVRKEIKWDDEISYGDQEDISTQSSSELSSNRCNSCRPADSMAKSRVTTCNHRKTTKSLSKHNAACSNPNKSTMGNLPAHAVNTANDTISYRSKVLRSPPPPGVDKFNARSCLAKACVPYTRKISALARVSRSSPSQLARRSTMAQTLSLDSSTRQKFASYDREDGADLGMHSDKTSEKDREHISVPEQQILRSNPCTDADMPEKLANKEEEEMKHDGCSKPEILLQESMLDEMAEAAPAKAEASFSEECRENKTSSCLTTSLDLCDTKTHVGTFSPPNDDKLLSSLGPNTGDSACDSSNMESHASRDFNMVHLASNNNHSSDLCPQLLSHMAPEINLSPFLALPPHQWNRQPEPHVSSLTSAPNIAEIVTQPETPPAFVELAKHYSESQLHPAFFPRPSSELPPTLNALCTSSSAGDLHLPQPKGLTTSHEFISRLSRRVQSTDLGLARAYSFVSRSQLHLDRCDRLIERSSDIIRRSEEMLATSRQQMKNTVKALARGSRGSASAL